jgi:uncharacterized protein
MTLEAGQLARVESWARERLEAHGTTAHGWLHVERVRRLAVTIARAEGVDPWLAELAALLHDVGRTVPGPGAEHGARSAELSAPLLSDLGLAEAAREQVLHAVRWHNSTRADTPLLCVLRDADMLDGMGAIGLMRAFMSTHMLPPYAREDLFEESHWPPQYVADQVRFQMTWVERLNTETGRRLAQERLAFMRSFVAQLSREAHVSCEPSERREEK